MGVEKNDSMSEVWTRWQGQVINAQYPLGACIGRSDHSGVFLTHSAALNPSAVAIKLVPTNRILAESQLPRWKRAGGLAHPHLLRLWEWGGCQLDGLPHLYAVMEYADQTLAQVLVHRALTETEAREMLPPILDALEFLHSRSLMQGRLKPTNILVVGDQLKLASDTICRAGEGAFGTSTPGVYDAPESRGAGASAAGDIWALGASLFEALTGQPPPALREPGAVLELPADFSPAFRDIVTRCLRTNPLERPSLRELMAWAHRQSAQSVPAVTMPPAAPATPETLVPERQPAPTESLQASSAAALSAAALPAPSTESPVQGRSFYTALLVAFVIIIIGATGVHLFKSKSINTTHPLAVQSSARLPPQNPDIARIDASKPRAPVSAPALRSTAQVGSTPATSPSAPQRVIPDVPQSARRTIHGHIKVWVRVRVDQDGSVQSATTDLPGPSRYFRRLALEAAKKWTFPPDDAAVRRLMQVQFDFSRNGTTGRAVALH